MRSFEYLLRAANWGRQLLNQDGLATNPLESPSERLRRITLLLYRFLWLLSFAPPWRALELVKATVANWAAPAPRQAKEDPNVAVRVPLPLADRFTDLPQDRRRSRLGYYHGVLSQTLWQRGGAFCIRTLSHDITRTPRRAYGPYPQDYRNHTRLAVCRTRLSPKQRNLFGTPHRIATNARGAISLPVSSVRARRRLSTYLCHRVPTQGRRYSRLPQPGARQTADLSTRQSSSQGNTAPSREAHRAAA